jgi:hypothetical protein
MSDDDTVVPFRRPIDPGRVIAEVGGSLDEAGVTLAIYGDDLDPEEVTAKLGVQPTRAHRRGDRRRPESQPFSAGAWMLARRGTPPVAPDQLLAELVAMLPLEDAEVWTDLRSRFSVQLRWGLHMSGWNRGFQLSGDSMRRILQVVESVGFDIYAYGEEDG